MAREFYATQAQVISAAARGLGLVSSDVADPFASTDKNILQLNQLLVDLGQDLLRDFDWQQLRAVTTVALNSESYEELGATDGAVFADDIPADFNRFIRETIWDRTNDQPLDGPVSPQGWQWLVATAQGSAVRLRYRFVRDQIRFWITSVPTGTTTIGYEYISRYWVGTSSDGGRSKEAPTLAADVLYFDKALLREGLKLRFAETKGLPSDSLRRNYEDALVRAKSGNEPSRTVSLNSSRGVRLVDGSNVADDGAWG